jgi:RimJ/RimL family protein N-acetyltransferase
VTQAARAKTLQFSALDSERFGLRVHRGSVDAVDADAIADEIERERIDVAILRLPAQTLGTVNGLVARGFAPIVADTLVAYDVDLRAYTPPPADPRLVLRDAERGDADTLARIAREVFEGYVSHYHANPLFGRAEILDGYAEWAAQHADGISGRAAWLIERDGELAGFSTYGIDRAGGTATGVLNGILPAVRGKGVYRAMLGAMLKRFADAGVGRFEISTQVHNIAVQRVWTGYELALRSASNTVHINALRNQGTAASSVARS